MSHAIRTHSWLVVPSVRSRSGGFDCCDWLVQWMAALAFATSISGYREHVARCSACVGYEDTAPRPRYPLAAPPKKRATAAPRDNSLTIEQHPAVGNETD